MYLAAMIVTRLMRYIAHSFPLDSMLLLAQRTVYSQSPPRDRPTHPSRVEGGEDGEHGEHREAGEYGADGEDEDVSDGPSAKQAMESLTRWLARKLDVHLFYHVSVLPHTGRQLLISFCIE